MTDWRNLSPMLAQYTLAEVLREEDGVETCRVFLEGTGECRLLKHLSVPSSQTQIEGLRLSGAIESDDDARKYYAQRMVQTQRELDALKELAAETGIACYDTYEILEKQDGIGFDLYLIAPDRETLMMRLRRVPLTRRAALRMATDLAGQLIALREKGYLHTNIKPENIYCTAGGRFTLGDLGIVPLAGLHRTAISEDVLGSFSAPELYDAVNPLNETVDTYALGLVLYYVFNGFHGPFEDEQVSPAAALELRLGGQVLPSPLYADYEVAEILQRACAFAPENRFESPKAFYDAINAYAARNDAADEALVPPLVSDGVPLPPEALNEEFTPLRITEENDSEEFLRSFSPAKPKSADGETLSPEQVIASLLDDAPPEKKRRKSLAGLWWGLGGFLLAAAIAAVVWLFVLTPTIEDLSLVSASSDAVTVRVDAAVPPERIAVTCTDTYGTEAQGVRSGKEYRFEGLHAGTAYLIRVEAAENGRVKGRTELTVQTLPAYSVLSLSAEQDSPTAAKLSYETDAPDAAWKIVLFSEGQAETTLDALRGGVILEGLETGRTYRVRLICEDHTVLGQTETEFTLTPPAPPEPEIPELPDKAGYTVSDLALASTDNAQRVVWSMREPYRPALWKVVCTLTELDENATLPQSDAALAFPGDSNEDCACVPFSGLIAGKAYRAELWCEDVSYGAVDFTAGSDPAGFEFGDLAPYFSFFLPPEKEHPTYGDFSAARTSFEKSEGVAFVLQAMNAPQKSDSSVTFRMLVLAENGAVTDCVTENLPWDDLWDNGRLCRVLPRTPQTEGKYTLLLLIDGKPLISCEFEIR